MATTASFESFVLKGTRHGLLASIREDSDWPIIASELTQLSGEGADSLGDASITFDFGWREISEHQFDEVIQALHSQGLSCNGILSTSLNTRTIAEDRGYRAIIGRLGLAKHQGRRLRREKESVAEIKVADVPETTIKPEKTDEPVGNLIKIECPPETEHREQTRSSRSVETAPRPRPQGDSSNPERPSSPSQEGVHVPRFQDEEPTLYLRKTLRGGQKVVFAGNVVLIGDLNPGAQIEADGDIIVMGQLRGTVHAGAEGDDSATVITSSLRATQLRIADRFWSGEKNSSIFKKSTLQGTLKARLHGESVVVEALPVR